jgi:dTDP-4-dehydrorhamnose 3,5-epimerase
MNILGVDLRPLQTHGDDRGSVTEVFRQGWRDEPYVQWNYVRSTAGILRGVHGHFRHNDYLVLLEGAALIGLRDLREGSPTEGRVEMVEMSGDNLQTLSIPPGVAHGFYFSRPSTLIYAVTHYWDTSDELGCRWDDPALGIPWPVETAQISPRDSALPGFAVFVKQMQEKMALAEAPQV